MPKFCLDYRDFEFSIEHTSAPRAVDDPDLASVHGSEENTSEQIKPKLVLYLCTSAGFDMRSSRSSWCIGGAASYK
jgi:hypothetical protein